MLKIKDLKGSFDCQAIFTPDSEIEGVPLTAENADKIAEIIEKNVKAQGCTDFRREGDTLYFGNQFYMLPKIKANREGLIVFRSADYIFMHEGRESFGNKPKAAQLTATGFIIECRGGKIEYVLKGAPHAN